MEKMNQVSVTEFMSKSKEEMYDNAVEMVEKYNRLVDICNDSAERMAEQVTRHKTYTNALNNDIADGNAKIRRLEDKVKSLETAIKKQHQNDITEYNRVKRREMELQHMVNDKNKKIRRLEEMQEDNTINTQYQELVDGLKKDLNYWKEAFETQATSLAEVRKLNDELVDTLNKSSDDVEKLEKQVEYLKKELDKTCTCKELDLKGHQYRETALVNALADKDDEIKELKEENSRLNARIKCDTEYWKNAFEAQSLDLADEKKHNKELNEVITELKEKRDKLKKECKNKNDIIRKAYTRYMDDVCENREEIMNECYKKLTKDDTGYTGFKQYTLRALETKKDEKEAKKFLSNAIDIIFYNKKAEEERKEEETKKELNAKFGVGGIVDEFKEEETEVKGNGRTSSGRYPWGAKVNDIPCGSDSIE